MLEDLGAQFGLAIGYGTWGTMNEEFRAVMDEFERARVAQRCKSGKFHITGIGQTVGYASYAARAPAGPQPRFKNRSEWLKTKLEEKRVYEPGMRRSLFRPCAQ
ncbi:hypothetical protein GTR04_4853 [Trichophyton interdigitale]|uniref:Uncharacterized protein n=1 Tax=Trichophyton interdigitale TaxID=101480 RepID=A0A9P4YH35_9EURO|nr:hypothetical protein GY631_4690 [Trichophyton interdigitale]KAF3897189.1 hypothetical protein GY632_2404 [Trichophyton interdigitale]KAG8207780.1 hypothetical protein GTR04_4853 [Trichophyton interdigitale]